MKLRIVSVVGVAALALVGCGGSETKIRVPGEGGDAPQGQVPPSGLTPDPVGPQPGDRVVEDQPVDGWDSSGGPSCSGS